MKRFSITGLLAALALSISHTALAEGRTDLDGPGDAEVIAGTGYQHTLFDSANRLNSNAQQFLLMVTDRQHLRVNRQDRNKTRQEQQSLPKFHKDSPTAWL